MNFSITLPRVERRLRRLISRHSANAWPAIVAGALATVIFSGTARADLLVLQPGGGGKGPGVVHRFDESTGVHLGFVGQINEAMRGMCLDANGELLVGANTLGQGEVYRFARSGQFLESIVRGFATEFMAMSVAADGTFYGIVMDGENAPVGYRIVRAGAGALPATLVEAGSGGLTEPRALAIGSDGHLYVADGVRGILRFHGTTGEFAGVLVAPGTGGLRDPTRLAFGPDGRLYVASGHDSAVLRFDGVTGRFVDTFVSSRSGGLNQPGGLAFAPDGSLFVSSRETHQVLRYDGVTGAFLNVFASRPELRAPTWLVFTPATNVAAASSRASELAKLASR